MAHPYDRIKQRREELNMSQADLATALKYSDRSTIAKIEKGVNDITQSKIEAFAAALHTTPAYLMGWTDDYYDYDTDEDSRSSEIPIALFKHLMEHHNDDFEKVWHSWLAHQDACMNDALQPAPSVQFEAEIKNPDIRMIARAGKKMTPEQAENLRKYAQYMFPEAFEDD